VVNACLNALTNLASHNANRVPLLRAAGVAEALVGVIRSAEPGSRSLRAALVTLTNLPVSCHKVCRGSLFLFRYCCEYCYFCFEWLAVGFMFIINIAAVVHHLYQLLSSQ
jgi:hypothetical protein